MFTPSLVLPQAATQGVNGIVNLASNVNASNLAYRPPAIMKAALGKVMDLFEQGQVNGSLYRPVPAKYVGTLPKGQLYFESQLALDTDGYVAATDKTTDAKTSLRWPDGNSVNANEVPYIALPIVAFRRWGIRMGDMAAVLYRTQVRFAIVADAGNLKLGEGSIQLHREFGFERIINGRVNDTGIDSGVVQIVFPNSGTGKCFSTEQIRSRAGAFYKNLIGSPEFPPLRGDSEA